MDEVKEHSTLLEKLDLLNKNASPLKSKQEILGESQCSLAKNQCARCRNHGVVFNPKGFYANASICDCVTNCKQCLGTALDVSSGIAKSCRLPNPKSMANLFNQAHIPVRYAQARIETFQNYSGNGKDVILRVRTWLEKLRQSKNVSEIKGIILEGEVGVGKTYLLTSLAKHLMFQGLSVKFVDFFQLITEIKAKYSLKQDVEGSILNPLLNVDVLLIDELGKGRRTNFEQTIIDQLVMGRYNQQKLVIASTNCSLDDSITNIDPSDFHNFPTLKAAVGERIYSRLRETCYFWKLTGDDYRYSKDN